MRMNTMILAAGILTVGLLPAQVIAPPIIGPNYQDLKAYLNLSDTQVQALIAVQKTQQEASLAIYKEIADKQTQLNNLLKTDAPDPFQVGQLTVDINNLRKKLPLSGDPYHTNALNVLTADQKTRLAGLVSALQLQPAANEAVNLNLIDRPKNPVTINPLLRFANEPASIMQQ
jgi:hypothetical protein